MSHRIIYWFAFLMLPISSWSQLQYYEVDASAFGLHELVYANTTFVDINADGRLDIWSGNFCYINKGNQKYEKSHTEAVVTALTNFGDYNNDGYPDALSLTVNNIELYKNLGPPNFQLVKVENAIPLDPEIANRQLKDMAWLDYDNDGYLDFYVTSYEFPIDTDQCYPDYLYKNNGNGTFSDYSKESGISQTKKCSRGVSILDYNNDGWQDIYVSSYRLQDNVLWANQRDGTFVNLADSLGVTGTYIRLNYGHTIATAVGDLDNNGCLDLFAPIVHHKRFPGDRYNHIWMNTDQPDHIFFDIKNHGIKYQEIGSSPSLVDLDNDGDLDVFYVNLYGIPGNRIFIYLNEGGIFNDVSSKLGVPVFVSREFALFYDFNEDGFLDFYIPSKGKEGNVKHTIYLSKANSTNKSVIFMLKGNPENKSNACSYGAKMELWANDLKLYRELNYSNGNSYGSMMHPYLHFGIGAESEVDSIAIKWPSGHIEKHYNLTADQHYYIKENKVLLNLENFELLGR